MDVFFPFFGVGVRACEHAQQGTQNLAPELKDFILSILETEKTEGAKRQLTILTIRSSAPGGIRRV